jgi:hypothetical protein
VHKGYRSCGNVTSPEIGLHHECGEQSLIALQAYYLLALASDSEMDMNIVATSTLTCGLIEFRQGNSIKIFLRLQAGLHKTWLGQTSIRSAGFPLDLLQALPCKKISPGLFS